LLLIYVFVVFTTAFVVGHLFTITKACSIDNPTPPPKKQKSM